MKQKARVQELASRCLDALGEKLTDPGVTVGDLAVGIEKLINMILTLEGKPIARKEIILKLQSAEGEVSQEYTVAIRGILEELLDPNSGVSTEPWGSQDKRV